MGCPVAVKRLMTDSRDSDRIFKVPLIHLTHHHRSTLSVHPALMSGDHRLETFVASQYLAFESGFYFYRSASLLHSLGVDAQRECDGVCKVQS